MKKRLAALLVLIMMLTLVAGCGAEKTIKTDEGKVKLEEGKATFEGKDGSKTEVNVNEDGGGVSLPDGYPKDLVPIIEDSQIQLANKNETDGKNTFVISLTSKKSAADVYKYYTDVLKDAQELSNSQMDKTYTIAGVKDNQRISIIITQDDDETTAQIGIEPQ